MDLLKITYTQQDTRKVIPAEEIFGEDAELLHETCKMILHHVLHPYEGCPTLLPLHVQIQIKSKLCPEKAGYMERFLDAVEKWQEANPKEAKEILEKRAAWEKERDSQLVLLKNIAERNNVCIKWHGEFKKKCRPDMWDVYRDNELLARICL